MKYTVAALAVATAANARPILINTSFDVVLGQPFELQYRGCDSGCTILLKAGPSSSLITSQTLTTSATGSSTTVTITGVGSGIYAFEIIDKNGDSSYSEQFRLGSSIATSSTSGSSSIAPDVTSSVPTSSSIVPDLTSSIPASSSIAPVSTITSTASYNSADNFLRRENSRVTVIKNHVYIDGGLVSEKGYVNENRKANQLNVTLSLDLSKSWRPETVAFTETKKPDSIPSLWKHAIFADENTDSFYIWAGRINLGPEGVPPPVKLWKFTADDKGGGTWNTEATHSSFNSLIRSEDGAYASTPLSGFWIGGTAYHETSKDALQDVRGVVSFNFKTKEWKNNTEAPFSPSGTLDGATATFIPNYGPNGLIMVLGGIAGWLPEAKGQIHFDSVYFFDPVTMRWFNQETTGTIPQPRKNHCAVGVKGSNTFDIFVYGGRSQDYNNDPFDDVHVLSLPGFVWTKADLQGKDPRGNMECVLAGKRQMLTIGGTKKEEDFLDPDQNPQGLGIFDLTEMKWKDQYNADAAAYESPQPVQKWYSDEGLATVKWSEGVEALFAEQNNNNSTNGDAKKSSSPPVPAIVGGTVGGVGAVVIMAGVAFYFLKRRRRSRTRTLSELQAENPTEKTNWRFLNRIKSPAELSNDAERRAELDGNGRPLKENQRASHLELPA